jgi:cytochrome oxidase Cu insertion factor (SCO1/SenC/PrrC family)
MQISKYIPRPLILVFALLVLALAALLWLGGPHGKPGQIDKPSLIGAPFGLQDLSGAPVTERDLRGHYSLIYFGYASEKDATPTELRIMAAALELLGPEAARIKAYFVTLDPGRDQPGLLKSYLGKISPELHGLTGTPEQIAAMARAYHVRFRQRPDPQDAKAYEMDYSPLLYLMGPDGKFIKPFAYTSDAKGLAEGLRMVLE